MQVHLLTREYPPFVYGGAGVHARELAKELKNLLSVQVHCFEGERQGENQNNLQVEGYDYLSELSQANPALKTLGVDLAIADKCAGADLVHSHTWYANMAGHFAKLLYGIPHVITAHSLEPLRPWKREQLGGGYEISSWAEKTAYEGADAIIAVSHGMKADILRCYPQIDPERVQVIHNGLDLSQWQLPTDKVAVEQTLQNYGINSALPTVVFVGRITRQKGLPHFLQAISYLKNQCQIVLCAGAPDTPEIAQEVAQEVEKLKEGGAQIVWIEQMLPHQELVNILSAAQVFVTPSIYEPMGIVNIEAMAMELPVVGTATGGIPDCIVDGETGYLVPIKQLNDGTGTPLEPEKFARDMAERIDALLADPALAQQFGKAGRKRVETHFTWEKVAATTVELYRSLK